MIAMLFKDQLLKSSEKEMAQKIFFSTFCWKFTNIEKADAYYRTI